MKQTVVSEFLRWWASPSSNPDFPKRFLRPVRYQRGGGMDDEDALWLVQRSLDHEDVQFVSEVENDGRTCVELLFTDPVTLLRHRARFEMVVDGESIVSVIESSEIVNLQTST